MIGKTHFLILFFFFSICVAQGQIINGKVLDEASGNPVPFASVGIVGTWKGTSTNLDGEFSIAVTDPVTIKVTCVGYESVTFNSSQMPLPILLKPATTELDEIIILDKAPNPRTIVRKAFASVQRNFSRQSFLQSFFYRHYCKDDSAYGRLIEATVDVWKLNGYRQTRHLAGEREFIRISHLRRSLDKTVMAQGHEPIAVNNVMQADLAGYQTSEKSPYPKFYDEVSDLKTDFENYTFSLEGVSVYDGQEVYKISYASGKDSIETTRGYIPASSATGFLYITLADFAFVKTIDIRREGDQMLTSSAYYQRNGNYYYPYHFVREGDSRFQDGHQHLFRIEFMSVDIQHSLPIRFSSTPQDKESLLEIPYDPAFWNTQTVLKTTPLEDQIIRDLGGGQSLDSQFERYRKYEWSTSDGGVDAAEKFSWLRQDSRNNRVLYLGIFPADCRNYLRELENFKKLNRAFRGSILFVLFVIEPDEAAWQETNRQLNLFADGIISYRINGPKALPGDFQFEKTPQFILISREGTLFATDAKTPDDPALLEDFRILLTEKSP